MSENRAMTRFPGVFGNMLAARLLDIANRCPVHRTPHSETIIPVQLTATG